MKIISKITVFLALLIFYSCATTTTTEKTIETKQDTEKTDNKSENEKTQPTKKERVPVASIPEVKFNGSSQRIELEDMFTENIAFSYDEECSNELAGKIKSSVSVAKAYILLNEGGYEILAREKAEDSSHASFYIFVDNEPYRVSPSEPPLQSFENTTRFPVTFTLTEAKKVLITVQANSPYHQGQTGMMIDYLQIRKVQ